MSFSSAVFAATFAAVASATVVAPTSSDPADPAKGGTVVDGRADATKKGGEDWGPQGREACSAPLLATFAQVHTVERVMLDANSPPRERFDALLADRVTGTSHPLDPELLELLRKVASRFSRGGAPRIELVSGFRSPKLNEMLRKKGHHVASHSQHSLGHACDFRVVLAGEAVGVDPRRLEREIRALGWRGGVGVYPTAGDWFVHADVGPNRAWVN